MSDRITLYFHGSEPGSAPGSARAFKFGDSCTFDKRTFDLIMARKKRSWFTKEEFDVILKSREGVIKERYGLVEEQPVEEVPTPKPAKKKGRGLPTVASVETDVKEGE